MKHTTLGKLSLDCLPPAPFSYRCKAVISSYIKRNVGPKSLLAEDHWSLLLGLPPKEVILKYSVEKLEEKKEIVVCVHLFSFSHAKDPMKLFNGDFSGKCLQEPTETGGHAHFYTQ